MRLTPNAASRNSTENQLTSLVAASVLVSLVSAPCVAQTSDPVDSAAGSPVGLAPEAVAADSPFRAAPTPKPAVSIVVVGDRLPISVLSSSLGLPILSRFTLRFAPADRFGPEDLFRARLESAVDIHVWMDTETPGVVRLYFANRAGTRYLVRTIEFSDRMDEMDREALAQVLESSLSALAEGKTGLTRKQAELLLEPPKPARSAVTPPRGAAPRSAPSAPSWRRQSRGWLPEAALFYRVTPHGNELPVVHGPGVRMGADSFTSARQLGVAASAQYQFPQRHQDDRIGLRLRALALRFDVRTVETHLVPRSGLVATLGPGLDATWLSAETREEAFEAERTRSSVVLLLAGGLAWQLRVAASVRLELGLGVELDLASVHYDILMLDGTERFVSRWPVRPTGSFGVELF